jgi:hypothetical protein
VDFWSEDNTCVSNVAGLLRFVLYQSDGKINEDISSQNFYLSLMPVAPFLIVKMIFSSSILCIRHSGHFQFRINFSMYESFSCMVEFLGLGIGPFEKFVNFK